ncbi:MAG: response regulator [Anaerolineae bacterium]
MKKILVIDDEQPIREEVMEWLQFEGYDVAGAENGRLGLEAIDRSIPDLILCDIAMPEIDGHEVLIEVRSNPLFNHIPFVFLTAAADRDAVRKGMNLGADDYLTKPFTHAEVLSTVHSRLQKQDALNGQIKNQLDSLHDALNEEHERLLLKSRLVAMFSHDFRNPLTSILSSSGVLRSYQERLSAQQQQKYFDRIDGSVHLLLQMLDDMLLVAELEGGHLEITPQPLDINEFTQTIVDEFRLIDQQAHKLTLHSTIGYTVMVDPKLLRQILANLISNALKYSPANTEVDIYLFADYGSTVLAIEDHGIGIPEEALPHPRNISIGQLTPRMAGQDWG